MDDTEDDARYPPNSYGVNHQQGYGSSNRSKLPVRNPQHPPGGNQYVDDDVEDDDDEDEEEEEEEELLGEEEEEDDDEDNGVQRINNHEDVDDDDDDDDNDNDDDDDDDNDQKPNASKRRIEDVDFERHPKKRKLKNLVSNYEFAPRIAAAPPSAVAGSAPKPSFGGGRNSLADWTEHETFVLLDAWGDRYLQHGRKSVRSEEWHEVAEKVSQESKTERTDTQCRNRLDTLKKKYKKEKMRLAEASGATSKWVYFKKMDVLMTSSPRQAGLSCGLDSGEYVFMNPRVYLNRANGLDEMRDSPGNSESTEDGGNDSDEPPKRKRLGGNNDEGSSFRLLANSVHKFSDIYEKIENSKRQQMVELEKMRMDFHRDLEVQKRQILERARAEIAKIRQGDDEENDVSTENVSG